ncbi:MAG: flagellar motor switch protein FliM [Sarcina sp.]
MSEVLSQSEIDALLSALSTGEVEPEQLKNEQEEAKIKVYDFKSPQKFSKEQIRTLELIHDNFARVVSNYLTGRIRKNAKVKLVTVEQLTYEEFIHSVPNPTVLINFKLAPLNGNLVFEFNPSFSFQIIDILLGGNGDRKQINKDFSDIDKNIIKQVAEGIIDNIKVAWNEILEVVAEVESMETNPALNQTVAPTEPVALITFSIEVGNGTSFINLCIPYLSIEKIMDKLVVQHWFEHNADEDKTENKYKLQKSIREVAINVTTELGITNITIDEFLKLTRGDVIKLDLNKEDPIKVAIENKYCYYGKPGLIGNKYRAVEILDIIEEVVEENE